MEKPKNKLSPLWLLLVFFVVMLYVSYGQHGASSEISYTDFKAKLTKGEITHVWVNPEERKAVGTLKDKNKVYTSYIDSEGFRELLEKHNVQVTVQGSGKGIMGYIFGALPMLLFIVIFIMFMSQLGKSGSGLASKFGASKAKLISREAVKTTFDDVAGMPEVKAELREVVDFLSNPQRYRQLGAKVPKGVLLVGPPGTGKTLLARAVAGEAHGSFFLISGSSFVEMFVGVGASRVRDLFETAKKHAPAIIFIDEIDALGKSRSSLTLYGGNDEREQTLNQLLAELDGFEQNNGIILMAATNRPDVLDKALLRPGRFDRRIVVPLPDAEERAAILLVHTKDKKLGADVDLASIGQNVPGFSGADLENLANEAALIAARENKTVIEMSDFEAAKDKVSVGLARKGRKILARDRELVAYHEAGHAVVGLFTKQASRPRKVTIISHGLAGGFTEPVYEERMLHERNMLLAEIQVSLGGRAAEEIFCRTETSGASNDLSRATELARRMVYEFGMGRVAGLVHYMRGEVEGFLGIREGSSSGLSEETRRLLDAEVRGLITDGYKQARSTLAEHREVAEKLVAMLFEKETVMLTDEVVAKLCEPCVS